MILNIFNIVDYYHFLIEDFLSRLGKDFVALDLTCGNGNDTLYLCNSMKGIGFIYAFDIQKEAVNNTKSLLASKCNYSNYMIINDSHENIALHVSKKIDLAVYNLGYMPKSISNISTIPDTTISSLKKVLKQLKVKGYVFIAAYPGHDEGFERDLIFKYLSKLDDKTYRVLNHKIININNYPPELFIIQKMHDVL
jgi:benzoyl-CoA reductase/2-hydroxyglutaryl-CoA dehydratase subunit BcrC/BadD/HgdB